MLNIYNMRANNIKYIKYKNFASLRIASPGQVLMSTSR